MFSHGWGYAAVGAAAIVLAALYALRLISAILHERRGSAVREDAGDLVSGELALVVPLVVILAALSAWPAAISERSFPADDPGRVHLDPGRRGVRGRMIDTPKVDWLALSPTLALLAVSALTLLGGVFYPRHAVRAFVVFVSVAGFAASAVLSAVVFDRSEEGTSLIAESMTRDRFGAAAALDHRASSASASPCSRGATGAATTSASTTRSSPPPRPGWCSSSPPTTS